MVVVVVESVVSHAASEKERRRRSANPRTTGCSGLDRELVTEQGTVTSWLTRSRVSDRCRLDKGQMARPSQTVDKTHRIVAGFAHVGREELTFR